MEAKHTPGPWNLEIGECQCFHDGNRVAITKSGFEDGEPYNVTVAEVWPADNDMDVKDGRLIAAAPGLLDTLTWTLEQLNTLTTDAFSTGGDRMIRDRLQEAIDKARGQG